MTPHLVLEFGAAFVVSLVFSYFVRGIAPRLGIVDRPDGELKVHSEPTPLGGGIAIVLSSALVLALAWAAHLTELRSAFQQTQEVAVLAVGAIGAFLLGLVDDVRGLGAWPKAIMEVLLACGLFASGIRIDELVLGHWSLALPIWGSLLLTVGWIVGITNSFNLLDGSDGVAGGAALFALLTFAAVSLFVGKGYAATLSLILAGSTLGFLFFNFPPASIFLGDSGSLFLGFSLASLGIAATQMAPTLVALAVPILSFGVPILDTGLAILRRFLRGEPIFKGDKKHIHHRMRELGHSPRAIAFGVWALSAIFGLLSLMLVGENGGSIAAVLIAAGVVGVVFVQRLKLPELMELRSLVQRGIEQREYIRTNLQLRDAIDRVAEVSSGAELLELLAEALSCREFARVEMWLDDGLGAAIQQCAETMGEGRGVLWNHMISGDGEDAELAWEVRLRLKDENRRVRGRLSLYRRDGALPSVTDIRLIECDLIPAMVRTLEGFTRPHSGKRLLASQKSPVEVGPQEPHMDETWT